MQAVTLPPWLSPWSSGLMYGQRVFKPAALDRERYRDRVRDRARQRSRLTIYTSYGHDDSHILRIGGWSSRANTVRPLAGWERYPLPLEREPWRRAGPAPAPPGDLAHFYPEHINVDWSEQRGVSGGSARGVRGAEEGGEWGGALRGWVAGTALLALLVLLARAAERCIEKKLFKRRRRSQEWPTPNVRATSRPVIDDGTVIIPGLENMDTIPADLSETLSVDLPPPYSECTSSLPTTLGPHKLVSLLPEEPPPPYSDCYVEFSNKNGVPSVLIFSRRRTPLVSRREIVGGSSTTISSNDEATTSEQNTENANTEIAIEAARNVESDECVTNARNYPGSDNGTLNVNYDTNGNSDADAGASSCEVTVSVNREGNVPKDRAVPV